MAFKIKGHPFSLPAGDYGIGADNTIYAAGLPDGVHDGVNYPAGTGPLFSAEDRAALGIIDEPDPVRADDRYFWNGDVSTPKDLGDLKTWRVKDVKETANSLLAGTAWYIERAADPTSGKAIPQTVLDDRKSVRDAADANEEAINATATVAELADLQNKWPIDKDAQ